MCEFLKFWKTPEDPQGPKGSPPLDDIALPPENKSPELQMKDTIVIDGDEIMQAVLNHLVHQRKIPVGVSLPITLAYVAEAEEPTGRFICAVGPQARKVAHSIVIASKKQTEENPDPKDTQDDTPSSD